MYNRSSWVLSTWFAMEPVIHVGVFECILIHEIMYFFRFVLAAVSPAVVIPSMITLQQKGLGVTKGIPTLVVAAASVDDILAISMFGVLLGISFSTGGIQL